MKPEYVIFDNGNTLIMDPFQETMVLSEPKFIKILKKWNIPKTNLNAIVEKWTFYNNRVDFAFASHFLQEEIWPALSLMTLASKKIINIEIIPFIAIQLLNEYRETLKESISFQPQIKIFKKLFKALKNKNTKIIVASNDRAHATYSLLKWAGLINYINYVFTSEEMSLEIPKAEKPNSQFFYCIFDKLGIVQSQFCDVVYVGDSEKNDIIPCKKIGIKTIRFINLLQNDKQIWLNKSKDSKADFVYKDPKDLFRILEI